MIRNIALAFLVGIFLGGCATGTPSPDNTLVCTVPAPLLLKDAKLSPIIPDKNGKITLPELMTVWLDDIGKYNNLKAKDDTLIDWVSKYCVTNSAAPAPPPPTAMRKQPANLEDILNQKNLLDE